MEVEASYTCPTCGEEIVVPIDWAGDAQQDYTEDCPVCCHPNLIHLRVDRAGRVELWAEAE